MAKKDLEINFGELKKYFKDTDKDKIALSLIDRAIFMQETLKDLEKKVIEQGGVTEMCQGSYSIERINPALQAYNNTIKNYTNVVKQIYDLIPAVEDDKDDFEDF